VVAPIFSARDKEAIFEEVLSRVSSNSLFDLCEAFSLQQEVATCEFQ